MRWSRRGCKHRSWRLTYCWFRTTQTPFSGSEEVSGIGVIRVQHEHIFSKLAYLLPVTLVSSHFNLIQEAVYSALEPLAGHYGGIVISGRWFVHEYGSVARASNCAAPLRLDLLPGHRPSENRHYSHIVWMFRGAIPKSRLSGVSGIFGDMTVQQYDRLLVFSHGIQSLDSCHVHQIDDFMRGWFFSQPVQSRQV